MAQLNPEDRSKYYAWLSQAGSEPATIKKVLDELEASLGKSQVYEFAGVDPRTLDQFRGNPSPRPSTTARIQRALLDYIEQVGRSEVNPPSQRNVRLYKKPPNQGHNFVTISGALNASVESKVINAITKNLAVPTTFTLADDVTEKILAQSVGGQGLIESHLVALEECIKELRTLYAETEYENLKETIEAAKNKKKAENTFHDLLEKLDQEIVRISFGLTFYKADENKAEEPSFFFGVSTTDSNWATLSFVSVSAMQWVSETIEPMMKGIFGNIAAKGYCQRVESHQELEDFLNAQNLQDSKAMNN